MLSQTDFAAYRRDGFIVLPDILTHGGGPGAAARDR